MTQLEINICLPCHVSRCRVVLGSLFLECVYLCLAQSMRSVLYAFLIDSMYCVVQHVWLRMMKKLMVLFNSVFWAFVSLPDQKSRSGYTDTDFGSHNIVSCKCIVPARAMIPLATKRNTKELLGIIRKSQWTYNHWPSQQTTAWILILEHSFCFTF